MMNHRGWSFASLVGSGLGLAMAMGCSVAAERETARVPQIGFAIPATSCVVAGEPRVVTRSALVTPRGLETFLSPDSVGIRFPVRGGKTEVMLLDPISGAPATRQSLDDKGTSSPRVARPGGERLVRAWSRDAEDWIRHPVVAVNETGRGVVTYFAADDVGIAVVAAPIACPVDGDSHHD